MKSGARTGSSQWWLMARSLFIATALLLVCTIAQAPAANGGDHPASGATHADSAAVAKLYFDQGVDEYEPGRLDSALVMFSLALRWDPSSSQAWQARGATLARMNRHEEAQAAFDRALRIRPNFLIAWWHRGCDNAVAGHVEDALDDLRHVIALDSTARAWPFHDACWDSLRDDPRLLELTR